MFLLLLANAMKGINSYFAKMCCVRGLILSRVGEENPFLRQYCLRLQWKLKRKWEKDSLEPQANNCKFHYGSWSFEANGKKNVHEWATNNKRWIWKVIKASVYAELCKPNNKFRCFLSTGPCKGCDTIWYTFLR